MTKKQPEYTAMGELIVRRGDIIPAGVTRIFLADDDLVDDENPRCNPRVLPEC